MVNKRVHILTSAWCTNNCIFCMENKSSRKFISISEAKKSLKEWLNYSKEVTFTSWEPTIHPKIIELVRLAKDLWYETIQIISNWRKYKDIDFVLSLIKAWVTDFVVSIHWYNSLLHDSIVRSKWSFNEVLRWIINISKLKQIYDIVFNTNTTIIKQNYNSLSKIVYFLEKFPIDSLVLNVVIPQEEANKNDTLVKYSIIAKECEKLIDFQDKYNNIYINWLPYCLWKKLNSMMWFREPIFFEQDDLKIARHSENYNIELDNNIDIKIINWKQKRNECKVCKYYNQCEWVWESYIWLFWWSEFIPIK